MRKREMVDLFAGAGGTTTGALQAAGRCGVDLRVTAVNHWELAIDTHARNHPKTRHYCADTSRLRPRDIYPDGRVDMQWASPECIHHSRASAGRPKNDQSRSTAWDVLRWAEDLTPKVVWVENVLEFREWGPLDDNNMPILEEKGKIFEAWLASFKALNMRVEVEELCAADYGVPTSRRRLIIQAARKGHPIVWPEPTHSKNGDGGKLPWPKFYDYVNWEYPSRSIFWRDKPLADATLRRIAVGIVKYAFQPFLIPQQSGHVCRSLELPIQTLTAAGAEGLVTPFLVKFYGTGAACGLDEPLDTVTTKARFGLVHPYLVQFTQRGASDESAVKPLSEPIRTITGQAEYALTEAFLVHLRGTSTDVSLDGPVPTITAGGCHLGLVQVLMDRCRRKRKKTDRFPGMVIRLNGELYYLDVLFRMLQPSELGAGQGFPEDYVFNGTKEQQYKQIGNAVPPGLSKALVSAQLPHL